MAQKDVADALIEAQGRLFSVEMGADIARDQPAQWFHWLVGAILMSSRIGHANAVRAAAALKREKLHTVEGILGSERSRRIKVLNENGYARYDNQGADYIHAAADLAKERYDGDLRRLREEAADPQAIADALTGFKGIGKVGAEIFCREAQMVWTELHPQAGGPALDAAAELGLPKDAKRLAGLAGSPERMARLVAALTRAALDGPAEEVRRVAG